MGAMQKISFVVSDKKECLTRVSFFLRSMHIGLVHLQHFLASNLHEKTKNNCTIAFNFQLLYNCHKRATKSPHHSSDQTGGDHQTTTKHTHTVTKHTHTFLNVSNLPLIKKKTPCEQQTQTNATSKIQF